jgi:hypothetical protein
VKVRQPKKHRKLNPAHNKRNLPQAQMMYNNQKELIKSEEMILVLVVLEKNTNTAMVDENYYY